MATKQIMTVYLLGCLTVTYIRCIGAVTSPNPPTLTATCPNQTSPDISVTYDGPASAIYPETAEPSECLAILTDGVWVLQNLTAPKCGLNLTDGVWNGTIVVQLSNEPDPSDPRYPLSCPAWTDPGPTVGSLLRSSLIKHAGAPSVGTFELEVRDLRATKLDVIHMGQILRIVVIFHRPPTETGALVWRCRAGDRFPSPRDTYDFIMNGCGDGIVIPKKRGFYQIRKDINQVVYISFPFRAFQLNHHKTIQFVCDFIVCTQNDVCPEESCDQTTVRNSRTVQVDSPRRRHRLSITSQKIDIDSSKVAGKLDPLQDNSLNIVDPHELDMGDDYPDPVPAEAERIIQSDETSSGFPVLYIVLAVVGGVLLVIAVSVTVYLTLRAITGKSATMAPSSPKSAPLLLSSPGVSSDASKAHAAYFSANPTTVSGHTTATNPSPIYENLPLLNPETPTDEADQTGEPSASGPEPTANDPRVHFALVLETLGGERLRIPRPLVWSIPRTTSQPSMSGHVTSDSDVTSETEPREIPGEIYP